MPATLGSHPGVRAHVSRARAACTQGNAIPVPCEDFEELVDLVSKGAVERGLIPVENSLAGTIHKNYDILLAHDDIQVVGEVTIPISHCLMALEGTELSDVRRVLSHPVALAQCERYLERLGLTPQAAYDTAGSAKLVAQQQLRDAAAIAGQGAAKRYGLKVLAQGVQDESTNHTRFLELCTSRQAPRPRVGHTARTSLIVGLASRPGSLVHALTILSMRNLDMTKLESR
jgi:prephenate dehydratase